MAAFERLFPTFPPGKPKTIDNLDAIDLEANTFLNNWEVLKFDAQDIGLWAAMKLLDEDTQKKFMDSSTFLKAHRLPSIHDLVKFIRNEVLKMRNTVLVKKGTSDTSGNKSKTSTTAPKKESSSTSDSKPKESKNIKSHATAERKAKCYICSGDHIVTECPQFLEAPD